MQFSLKAPDGTVIESYKDRKAFIQIAGMEYEKFIIRSMNSMPTRRSDR
jgi:hypothetical protein